LPAGGAVDATDLTDDAVGDGDVRGTGRGARPVDHRSGADDQVVHVPSPLSVPPSDPPPVVRPPTVPDRVGRRFLGSGLRQGVSLSTPISMLFSWGWDAPTLVGRCQPIDRPTPTRP